MINGLCSLSIENHKVTDHLSAFLSYLIERSFNGVYPAPAADETFSSLDLFYMMCHTI